MKRKRFVLLIILLAIIYPRASKAQMPVTASNPSTEREIPHTPNDLPIKAETWREEWVISLTHYYPTTQNLTTLPSSGELVYYFPYLASESKLRLTELGTNNVEVVTLNNCIVTDFCIANDIIYLCGYDNSTYTNFITYVGVNELFNDPALLTLNLRYINLPSDYYLTKIDYYSTNVEKLSLLANKNSYMDSYFITYYLPYDNYEIFNSPRVRLLDIVHTNNNIGILGMRNDTTFTLISHNIDDFHLYQGKYFVTGNLYTEFPEPRFHMTNLRMELNQVVIGASVHTISGLQFTIADLTSVSMLYTQSVMDQLISSRSKILSMKFDERDYLYCLFANAAEDTKDKIAQLQPYSATPYVAFVYTPYNSTEYYNLLQDITLYRSKNAILAFGRELGLDLYLYDRDISSTNNYCDRISRTEIKETKNPIEKGEFLYYNQSAGIATAGIANLTKSPTSYIINCQ